MAKINYADKQDFRTTATSANKKVTAADMNEIKESVNALYDLVPEKKVYKALLNQTGTNAPVATVLENTLGGTINWTYTDVGSYTATLTNAFTVNKSTLSFGLNQLSIGFNNFYEIFSGNFNDENSFYIETGYINVSTGTKTSNNGVLNNHLITIEVYP